MFGDPLLTHSLSIHVTRSRLVQVHELSERGILIGDNTGFLALDAGGKGSYSARLLSVYLEPGLRWDIYDQSPYKNLQGPAVRFYQVLQQIRPASHGNPETIAPEIVRVRFLTETELIDRLPYPPVDAL